ncbi:MAG: hypothetical protein JRJ03_08750 [Deltaproteobacteria bacterium]|nr:hypothetical protein [Deltaproteobacteria bacterium]
MKGEESTQLPISKRLLDTLRPTLRRMRMLRVKIRALENLRKSAGKPRM